MLVTPKNNLKMVGSVWASHVILTPALLPPLSPTHLSLSLSLQARIAGRWGSMGCCRADEAGDLGLVYASFCHARNFYPKFQTLTCV